MTVRVLWSLASLLIALGAAIAVPAAYSSAPVAAFRIAFILLLIAALALLATMLMTLTRRDPFDDFPSLDGLPAILAWPIRVGGWVGLAATGLAMLAMALTTPGGGPVAGSARFSMSLMAVFGALTSFFTWLGLPDVAVLALMALWGTVIAIAFARGLYGLITKLFRSTTTRRTSAR